MSKIKKETTRLMFGLTQQEIAMVLNVTRSHWAHYERKTRPLPSAAGLWLSEMILHMCSPEAKASKSLDKPEYEDKKTLPLLEKRLKANEYQLKKITRKIDKAQQKFGKYEKATQLMSFLN